MFRKGVPWMPVNKKTVSREAGEDEPVSLHGRSFVDVMKALVRVRPAEKGAAATARKVKRKKKLAKKADSTP